MASRLSLDAVKQVYETGHRALNWDARGLTAPGDEATIVDIDLLLDTMKPGKAVRALAPQTLYRSIFARGLEDCVELMPHLSQEQFVRLIDYDAWSKDALEPVRFFRWLKVCGEISTKEVVRRFRSLDEELQIALTSPLVRIYDLETYDELGHAKQDALTALPGGELWYEILTDDKEVVEGMEALIQATMAEDMAYAISLLAHATYLPPNEQAELALQFRTARLEEDGFVSYEESLAHFLPLPEFSSLTEHWRASTAGDCNVLDLEGRLVRTDGNTALFLDSVLAAEVADGEASELFAQTFVHAANSLAAACLVEAHDLNGLKAIVTQARSLASLALERLSSGRLDVARRVLRETHALGLVRYGLTMTFKLQKELLKTLDRHGMIDANGWYELLSAERRGVLLHRVDEELGSKLGMELCEVVKGALNRFPMKPVYPANPELALERDEREAGLRLTFKPIASVSDYFDLACELERLNLLLFLSGRALGGGASSDLRDKQASLAADLETQLNTALANYLVDRTFACRPLDLAEVRQVARLPREAAFGLFADLCQGIDQTSERDLVRIATTDRVGFVVPHADVMQSFVLLSKRFCDALDDGDTPSLRHKILTTEGGKS